MRVFEFWGGVRMILKFGLDHCQTDPIFFLFEKLYSLVLKFLIRFNMIFNENFNYWLIF